jgi:hypothetical protein
VFPGMACTLEKGKSGEGPGRESTAFTNQGHRVAPRKPYQTSAALPDSSPVNLNGQFPETAEE